MVCQSFLSYLHGMTGQLGFDSAVAMRVLHKANCGSHDPGHENVVPDSGTQGHFRPCCVKTSRKWGLGNDVGPGNFVTGTLESHSQSIDVYGTAILRAEATLLNTACLTIHDIFVRCSVELLCDGTKDELLLEVATCSVSSKLMDRIYASFFTCLLHICYKFKYNNVDDP